MTLPDIAEVGVRRSSGRLAICRTTRWFCRRVGAGGNGQRPCRGGHAASRPTRWSCRRVGAAGSGQRSSRCGGATIRVTHALKVDALDMDALVPNTP
jgi:hypothetical protein